MLCTSQEALCVLWAWLSQEPVAFHFEVATVAFGVCKGFFQGSLLTFISHLTLLELLMACAKSAVFYLRSLYDAAVLMVFL